MGSGSYEFLNGKNAEFVVFLSLPLTKGFYMKVCKRLWKDDAGFVVSAELVLVATIAVIGLLVGMTSVRDGIVSELSDVAGAIQDVNQSYDIDGVVGHSSATSGFGFQDDVDFCDDADDTTELADNCITFDGAILDEDGAFVGLRNDDGA